MKNCNHTGGIEPKEIEFYLYDHLGNTRVVYQPKVAGANLELVINYVADYFPYGKILKEYVNTGSGDPEKFLTTQHERDQETGLDYRGARYYDSHIARFLSLDPLAKEFPSWSAYNYVMGNPISLIDPDGKAPQDTEDPKKKENKKPGEKDKKENSGGSVFQNITDAVYSGNTFKSSGSSGSGLGSSFANGFIGGARSTWDFVKGQFFGQSYWDGLANTFSMGIYGSVQTVSGISNAVSNIPNYTANDYAYGAGFFTEKALEALVLKRVAGGSTKTSTSTAKVPIKLIGPAGDAGAFVTRQVPSSWIIKPANKGAGTRFIDPTNAGNHIRVMSGDPSSPFINSQTPYTIRYINGSPVDRFGNKIINTTGTLQNKAPSLHVPANQFKFK